MKDLIPVLESLSISTAISLDDDCNVAYDPAKQGALRVDDFLRLYREHFSDTEINELDDSGVLTIFDLFQNDTISHSTKDRVATLLMDLQQIPSALRFLEDGFKDSSIEFKKFSTLEGLPYVSEEGTIWFIDKEIDGNDILSEVIPLLCKDYGRDAAIIIVVFTSDISLKELNFSWKKRYDYLVNYLGLDAENAQKLSYSFFVILKKDIEDYIVISNEDAQSYLSSVLMSSMSGYCTYHIIQRMRNHAEDAFSLLLDVAKDSDQRTFQNIHYNMTTEGEPNVYHAFKSILDYMQEYKYINNFEQYSRYIMAMKRLAHIPQQEAEMIGAQSLKDILQHYEWAQFQFIHKDANQTYADISRGDVFRLFYLDALNQRCQYIGVLITQPCDCILRKNGSEIMRNASRFTLVLFEEKTLSKEELDQPDSKTAKKEWKRRIKKLRDSAILLSEDGTRAFYIDTNSHPKALLVQPFILDMTSLNNEGKAILLDAEGIRLAIKQNKTDNWNEYSSVLEQEVSQHQEQIQLLYNKMEEDADKVICSLYGISFSRAENRFCIERVGHLEANMAEFISYNYIKQTYRAGKSSLLSLSFNLDNSEGDT